MAGDDILNESASVFFFGFDTSIFNRHTKLNRVSWSESTEIKYNSGI